MPPTDDRPRSASAWRGVVGFCVGAALLGAAAWVAWRDRHDLADAAAHAREARWWQVVLLVTLPWVSWTLTSMMYWALMNRSQRRDTRQHVGLGEMHAVLASAWLMNYLPARPGMFGRLAYHKVVNGIPLPESIRASVVAIACGVASMLLLLCSTLLARALQATGAAALVILVCPGVLAVAVAAILRTRHPSHEVLARTACALAARYADVLSWMARYVVLYATLGRPLSLLEAAAFTIVSQIAGMVPFVGNGLGIREWSEGLLGPRLAFAVPQPLAFSAGLLHRAAEVAASLPVGLVGGLIVARRMRATST